MEILMKYQVGLHDYNKCKPLLTDEKHSTIKELKRQFHKFIKECEMELYHDGDVKIYLPPCLQFLVIHENESNINLEKMNMSIHDLDSGNSKNRYCLYSNLSIPDLHIDIDILQYANDFKRENNENKFLLKIYSIIKTGVLEP